MLKPWIREVCRMPDGGGVGADGGSAGYSDPVGGVGMNASGMAGAPDGEPGYSGQAGRDLEVSLGRGANYDMAEGWQLSNPNQVAEDIGFEGADYGRDYGRAATSAWNAGNYGLAAGRGALGLLDGNYGTLAGLAATALGGPLLGAAVKAGVSYAIDGKGPFESALSAFTGAAVPGLPGLFASRGAGMGGAAIDAHLGQGPTGAPGTTSFAFDSGPPSQEGPAAENGGGTEGFIAVPGQTYEAYLPPAGSTAYPQPAWRGLLGRNTQPPANLWQGNHLMVPGRGLLS